VRLIVVLFALVTCLLGQEKIIFTKSFPGSVPPYCSVQVAKDGALEYKETPAEEKPLSARLSQAETDALFDMTARLDHFKGNLESGLKVANTGRKTFRYESATGEKTETVFNYSQDVTAHQLWDRFEQIAESERAYIDLDRAIHFDKLGVNDALALIEQLWLNKELAAPLQFVPLLTRVATHEAFMHLARERAARLKDEFTAPSPAAP
jgi:hypothetical protein